MPEMQQTRYLDGPLGGVHLGDTLYLPERVEVRKDAVILARRLVFEGNDVLIKGPHSVALFPAKNVRCSTASCQGACETVERDGNLK